MAVGARGHALGLEHPNSKGSNVILSERSGGDIVPDESYCYPEPNGFRRCRKPVSLEPNEDSYCFAEVPHDILEEKLWDKVYGGKWDFGDSSLALEANAVV